MKKKNNQSMDDILFEGRNKAYGAYLIRKKYKKHLAYGLIISISIILGILYLIIKFSEIHSTDYYLNPRLNGHSTSMDISDQVFGLKTIKSSGRLSDPGLLLPKVIPVPDAVISRDASSRI